VAGITGLGTGVATALTDAANATGGFVTSPVPAANLPTLIGCPYGGTTGGTAAAQTLTVPNIPTTVTQGTCISFTSGFASTGSTTLTVTPTGGSAYSALALDKRTTGGIAVLSSSGDLTNGGVYQAIYDGSEWVLGTTSSTVYTGGSLTALHPLTGNSANQAQANANATINAAGVYKGGNSVLLTADSSGITATTPATATTIFTLPTLTASTNYSIHCSGTTTQATAGGGIGISVTFGTTAPTNAELHATVATGAAVAAFSSSGPITSTTATAIYTGSTGTLTTQLPWYVDGSIEAGATAPASIIIGFFSASASDSVVVKRDSYCTLMP